MRLSCGKGSHVYSSLKIALAISLLFVSAAYAQEPSKADKVAALKRAYRLEEPVPVKTVPIAPVAEWTDKNKIDALADRVLVPPPATRPRARVRLAENNDVICARHHMHKVWYGDKWRCRK